MQRSRLFTVDAFLLVVAEVAKVRIVAVIAKFRNDEFIKVFLLFIKSNIILPLRELQGLL
jgi:hypothetical protein